jgi:hypothetical protein
VLILVSAFSFSLNEEIKLQGDDDPLHFQAKWTGGKERYDENVTKK